MPTWSGRASERPQPDLSLPLMTRLFAAGGITVKLPSIRFRVLAIFVGLMGIVPVVHAQVRE